MGDIKGLFGYCLFYWNWKLIVEIIVDKDKNYWNSTMPMNDTKKCSGAYE